MGESLPPILVKILAGVFVLVLGYWGWLYFSFGKNAKEINNLNGQITSLRTQALNMADRPELATRQLQLKEYSGLLDKQIYWSQLMPVLASSTLKTATYNSLKVSPEGTVSLNVSVPQVEELDKFLQVFDLPQYNKYFNNVRISSLSKVQTAAGTQIRFEVKFNYDPELIKPKESK